MKKPQRRSGKNPKRRAPGTSTSLAKIDKLGTGLVAGGFDRDSSMLQHLRDLAATVTTDHIVALLEACQAHDDLDVYDKDAYRMSTQKIRMLLGVCEAKPGGTFIGPTRL